MSKLRMKIAALFTAGISILPNVSSNVVKANDSLQEKAFVENFQKKNIPVYRTENNLLVDANLNYINVEGKPLNKDESKVPVSNELNEKISLHPVLKYIDENKNDFVFSKSQLNDGTYYIFVKTGETAPLKMLYFDSTTRQVYYTQKISSLAKHQYVNVFGNAVPILEQPDENEKKSLVAKLQSEGDAILKDKKNNQPSQDNEDSYIAAFITALIGVGLMYYVLPPMLSPQGKIITKNELDWD